MNIVAISGFFLHHRIIWRYAVNVIILFIGDGAVAKNLFHVNLRVPERNKWLRNFASHASAGRISTRPFQGKFLFALTSWPGGILGAFAFFGTISPFKDVCPSRRTILGCLETLQFLSLLIHRPTKVICHGLFCKLESSLKLFKIVQIIHRGAA